MARQHEESSRNFRQERARRLAQREREAQERHRQQQELMHRLLPDFLRLPGGQLPAAFLRERMRPHQLAGFKFMWHHLIGCSLLPQTSTESAQERRGTVQTSIASDGIGENQAWESDRSGMQANLNAAGNAARGSPAYAASDMIRGNGGCILAHAPGTGKPLTSTLKPIFYCITSPMQHSHTTCFYFYLFHAFSLHGRTSLLPFLHRTGKTLTTIAVCERLLWRFPGRRILIASEPAVLGVWQAEFSKWLGGAVSSNSRGGARGEGTQKHGAWDVRQQNGSTLDAAESGAHEGMGDGVGGFAVEALSSGQSREEQEHAVRGWCVHGGVLLASYALITSMAKTARGEREGFPKCSPHQEVKGTSRGGKAKAKDPHIVGAGVGSRYPDNDGNAGGTDKAGVEKDETVMWTAWMELVRKTDVLICDEGHLLKDPTSQIHLVSCRLLHAEMTG